MTNIAENKISSFFKKNGWVKIEKVIDLNMANLLYYHTLLEEKRYDYLAKINGKENVNEDLWGTKKDKQALGDFSKYGEGIFDTLLSIMIPKMEYFTGLNLNPQYTYHRLYTNNSELKRHKDRESCEISTTLCLGYDVSNVDNEKYNDYNWPIFLGSKVKENNLEIPVSLKPGDMLIYRGCDLEHWREPFIGKNHAQLFLHYTEKKVGSMINDGRELLGLPKFRKSVEVIVKDTEQDNKSHTFIE